jgi:RNA polymerase sigma-70 factor (ECF subfamily)
MPASRPPLQDPESFSALYTRTHLIIFRFIYGIHGGPIQEVEDITCDTFMKAWKGRKYFSGDDQDAARWLFTIARNLVIDAYRKSKTQRHEIVDSLDEINYDPVSISTNGTPEEITIDHEDYQKLWVLFQKLPFERREMLVLRYMCGWHVKDIATYLEMEENTVSVYIHRSLDRIRLDWGNL